MERVERISLSDQDVAYLVGRSGALRAARAQAHSRPPLLNICLASCNHLLFFNHRHCAGATRMRLERFSGTKLNIDRDVAEIEGSPQQRALAKLAISITLQQRDGGAVAVDFDDLEKRDDVSTFDVPKETVGFLLGAKGSTLRTMETNHKVFMFFNNDRIRQGKSVSSLARRALALLSFLCLSLPPSPLPLPLPAGACVSHSPPLAFFSSSSSSAAQLLRAHQSMRTNPCPTRKPHAPRAHAPRGSRIALATRRSLLGKPICAHTSPAQHCPPAHARKPTGAMPHRPIGLCTAKYAWCHLLLPFT